MKLTRKQKRLSIIALLGGVLSLAALLIFSALREQIVFFYDPTELAAKAVPIGQPVRIGGLVKQGSWTKNDEDNVFTVTDGQTDAEITYTGILPDLFREGQGVIAEGALSAPGQFTATTVLAKHDEKYIPKEVAESLKERGEWRPDAAGGAKP